MDSPRKRILVVDDDFDLRSLVEMQLGTRGFDVEGAGDGLEALEKVGKNIPDVILLDLMLPQMDGFEVNLRLKQKPETARIPVIVLTAYGDLKELQEMSKDMRIVAYLEKPARLDEVLSVVQRVLGLQK